MQNMGVANGDQEKSGIEELDNVAPWNPDRILGKVPQRLYYPPLRKLRGRNVKSKARSDTGYAFRLAVTRVRGKPALVQEQIW